LRQLGPEPAAAHGHQEFPAGADEVKALTAVIDEAWKRDMLCLSNRDIGANRRRIRGRRRDSAVAYGYSLPA
jgi:hypothetical protein